MMISLKRYASSDQAAWDDFVRRSKNGTFLFIRNYMDYHSDRFTDHSLLFRNEKGHIIALLPANEKDGALYSHQGLTYGGLIMNDKCTTADIIEVFKAMKEYMQTSGINQIIYKAIPWIYHTVPSEEPLYAMHYVFNYELMVRQVSSVIVIDNPLKWRYGRKYQLNVARKNNIKVTYETDFAEFWEILVRNLQENHNVSPVHTLEEMTLLHSRLPENITLATAKRDGELLGGVVLYRSQRVVHTQYIAATGEGKRLGAIDAIIDAVIHDNQGQAYLDFGHSTESQGKVLNYNLIFQKEGFGARAVCYDTYRLTI